LAQIQTAESPIPVEVLTMEKASNATLVKFAEVYATHERVGYLAKDQHTGKIMDEWKAAVAASESKPELFDMTQGLSAVLCVKDEDELVRVRLVH
jgi:nucleosome binding factor SPN SPT16 subunit